MTQGGKGGPPDDDDANARTQLPTHREGPRPPQGASATMPAQAAPRGASETMPAQSAPPPPSGTASLADVIGDVSTRLRQIDPANYLRLDELARGGLGRILRARDERTGRIVAIKEVLHAGDGIALRLAREALITAHLQHPAIVPVYEAGVWPHGEPFYAMKLVRGRSLEDGVAETSTLRERLALLPHVLDVADALAYAHGERVIHRDLKPANVLLGDFGETVVIDWGLAKNLATGEEAAPAPTSRLASRAGETLLGTVMGTPAYMPPEQARGELVDERADVYAIGALLYHVLGGRRPYAELGKADSVLEAVQAGPPRAIRELAPGLPVELAAIVMRAMAARPDDRYRTARELADDLRRFQTGQLVGAHEYSLAELIARFVRRHRAAVATAAIALVVIAAFGAWSFVRITRERDVARTQRLEADKQRGKAEVALRDLQLEEGRQASLAGDPARALAFLVEAARAEGPTPGLLAGHALAAYASTLAVAPPHKGGTLSVTMTPDHALILSSGADETLRAWDVAANRERWTVAGPAFVQLTPDGAHVIAVGVEGKLFAIRVADGTVVARAQLGPPGEDAIALAISPDGTRAALGSHTGRLGLFALPTLAPLPVVDHAHTARIRDVAFSTDGTILASVGDDGALHTWDATTLAPRAHVADAHPGGASKLVAARDLFATAGGTSFALWDAKTARLVRRTPVVDDDGVYDVTFSPDGTRLATSTQGGLVTVVDVATGKRTLSLPREPKGVPDLRYTPDGRALVTLSEEGRLAAFDAVTGAPWQRPPSDGPAVALDVSAPDHVVVAGRTGTRASLVEPSPWSALLAGPTARVRAATFAPDGAIYAVSDDGSLRRWRESAGPGPIAAPRPHTDGVVVPTPGVGVTALGLSPDAATLVTGHDDGAVRVWSLPALTPIATLPAHTARVRVARFQDGVLFTAGEDGKARTWDPTTHTPRATVDAGGPLLAAALAAGGTRILTLRKADGVIGIWDATTGAAVKTPALPPTRLPELGLSPDGKTFAIGHPTEVWLLDAATGTKKATLPRASIFNLTWAADGKSIASGDGFGELWLFDATTGAPRGSVKTDDKLCAFLRLSSDGALAVTVGSDRTPRVWETASMRLLVEGPRFPAEVLVIDLAPDGRRVVLAAMDGTTRVLDLRPADPAKLADVAARVAPRYSF